MSARSGLNRTYKVGSVAALLTVVVGLLDIIVSSAQPQRDVQPGKLEAADWFARFGESRLLTLRDLGLLNIVNTCLWALLHLAIYTAHRQGGRRGRGPGDLFGALGVTLSSFGALVYAANNKALPMLALSRRYAAAGTDREMDEKARLEVKGQAMLAKGEDFTPGSFPGFLFAEVGGICTGVAMLRGGVFSRLTGWLGITGSGLLLAFTSILTFAPGAFRRVMVLAMAGGILSMGWHILSARRLFDLGRVT
jgi:hypothetical protein